MNQIWLEKLNKKDNYEDFLRSEFNPSTHPSKILHFFPPPATISPLRGIPN